MNKLQPVDIQSALSCIPPDDRDLWVQMAMAIKSELGDSGFSLWDHWSQSGDNYKERDARSVWQSIRGHGVGIGTLIFHARQYGWQKDSDYIPPVIQPKPAPKPAKGMKRYALELWIGAAHSGVETHPYAVSKGVNWPAGAKRGTASGKVIGRNADCIIVPIRDLHTEKVEAVQCINTKGDKQTFGSLSGHGLLIGNTLNKSIPWYVVEGWASAVSTVFHHHKGNACSAVAFGKSNLYTLAGMVADVYAPSEITVIEEDDA